MTDRTVKVTLALEAQGYLSGMDRAAKATKATGSEAEKLAAKKQAFNQLGTAAVAVGVGITAIGVAALKTGVAYNTLQQTTRKALTTILGSASAAADQMDRLDEFAKTSPFAKSTFITAQQQMLAFGIEAKKVVPYLDAIQNAVAAAGGSNADIAGITATMSKIQSAAKITGQDLIEFGNRGINAAELIGSQMGKTGAQIREDITAGSIGATEALDALSAGMAQNFEGAAAGVKDTFAGALDRMKAAWRDFSSELAEPLVGKEGGGALVDLLNWTADAMRAFEKLPEPVKVATTAVVGTTGAVLLLGGTALLAVPKLAAMKGAMSTLGITAKGAGLAVGGALAVVALFAVGIAGAGSKAELTAEQLAKLRDATNRLDSQKLDEMFKGAADHSHAGSSGIGGFKDALDGLTSSDFFKNRNASKVVGGFIDSIIPIFNLSGDLKEFEAQFASMGETLATVADRDFTKATDKFNEYVKAAGGGEEVVGQLLQAMPEYKAKLIELASAAGLATDDQSLLNLAQGEGRGAARLAAAATDAQSAELEKLSGKAQSATTDIDKLASTIAGFGSTQLDTNQASREFEAAIDDATAAVDENGKTLDISTAAGRTNEAALDKIASAAINLAAAKVRQTGKEEDATAAIQQGRDAVIKARKAMGDTQKQAETYADSLGLIPKNVKTAVGLTGLDAAEGQLNSWIRGMNGKVVHVATSWSGGLTEADGGIVDYYAKGGIRENHIAQIAPAGAWRVWAEPETGGEAYIPFAAAKRERSLEIWAETGSRLGVAGFRDGGMVAPPKYVPAPQQYMYAPQSQSAGGGQRPVEFSFTTINPVAETTTESTRKAGQLIGASLGV